MARPLRRSFHETRSMAKRKEELTRALRPRPEQPQTPPKKSSKSSATPSTSSTSRSNSVPSEALVVEFKLPLRSKLIPFVGPRMGSAKRKPLYPMKSIRDHPEPFLPCRLCCH